jgi:uncharacterized protein YegL
MTADGLVILPFYLVADVSASMRGEKLDALNKVTPSVVDSLSTEPILADKVRFGVISFSDTAEVELPLCDLLEGNLALPQLSARGRTSYGAAFTRLRSEITDDVAALKADGYQVHRPVAFFISDGEPTDSGWDAAFRALTEFDPATNAGFAAYPNVIPCGVGDAEAKTLARLIHPPRGPKAMRMYLMNEDQNPAAAITKMAEILVSSIVETGYSVHDGQFGVQLPRPEDLPPGITSYGPDVL